MEKVEISKKLSSCNLIRSYNKSFFEPVCDWKNIKIYRFEYDNSSKNVYTFSLVPTINDKPIAEMTYTIKNHQVNTYHTHLVVVNKKFRNHHFIKKIYKKLMTDNPKLCIISDNRITEDGLRLWKSLYQDPFFLVYAGNKRTESLYDVHLEDGEFVISDTNVPLLNNKIKYNLILEKV